MEPTLSQALHLLNGDTTNAKIAASPVTQRLSQPDIPPDQVISELYERCLSRKPTTDEVNSLIPLFGEGSDRGKAVQDVFWALLNSREILFNH